MTANPNSYTKYTSIKIEANISKANGVKWKGKQMELNATAKAKICMENRDPLLSWVPKDANQIH